MRQVNPKYLYKVNESLLRKQRFVLFAGIIYLSLLSFGYTLTYQHDTALFSYPLNWYQTQSGCILTLSDITPDIVSKLNKLLWNDISPLIAKGQAQFTIDQRPVCSGYSDDKIFYLPIGVSAQMLRVVIVWHTIRTLFFMLLTVWLMFLYYRFYSVKNLINRIYQPMYDWEYRILY